MIELKTVCLELLDLEKSIDAILESLNPDTSKIRSATMAIEELMSAEALEQELANLDSQNHRRRYNVTGFTRLRWMLDEHIPTFAKVDEQVANQYRKKLLQYCHPDKGNTHSFVTFELVKLAYATSNVELLALMVMSLDESLVDDSKLETMIGTVTRKLANLKTKPSFKVLQMYVTKGPAEALVFLQTQVNRTAVLLAVASTQKGRSPDSLNTQQENQ